MEGFWQLGKRYQRRQILGVAIVCASQTLVVACGGASPTDTPIPSPAGPSPTPTPRPTVSVGGQAGMSWTDYEGRVRLNYPSTWTVKETGGTGRMWTFTGPQTAFNVTYREPSVTLESSVQRTQQETRSGLTNYAVTFGPVTDLMMGIQPAKRYDYTATNKQGGAMMLSGTTWNVLQGAKWFTFEGVATGARNAIFDAVVSSITLLRRQDGSP